MGIEEQDVEAIDTDTAPAQEDREIPPPDERANLPEMAMPGTAIVTPLTPQPTEPAAPVPPPEEQPFREPRRQPNPPAGTKAIGDRIFNGVTAAFAALILVILGTLILVLVVQSRLSIQTFGFGFLYNTVWDSVAGTFGARSAIVGTIYTSLLALLIAGPVGLMVAMFLTEMAPRAVAFWIGFVVELLAAVPSIVYGLWALFILVPFVRDHLQIPIASTSLGNTPLFSGYPLGLGFGTAALILAIMILPTIASISRDVMLAVPNTQRDAMLALGATKWETTWKVVVPYARSGIIGAIVLAFGRAVGETMAVQMVIGNNLQPTSLSLFNTGMTMPSLIVTQFQEATTAVYESALIELALVLMVVTLLLNAIARLLVWRMTQGYSVQV